MKATFKLTAEVEVTAENSAGGYIALTIRRGVWFDGEDTRTVTELFMEKSEARAIASALMGCAAKEP